MRTVTLEDVAKTAGVSYQTVSRVVNNAHNVSEKTKVNVQHVINKLGYVPNRAAQQLARKQHNTIGLITVDIALHAPAQLAASIKRQTKLQQFNIIVAIIDDFTESGYLQIIRELQSQQIDGLIINAPMEPQLSQNINKNLTIPCLLLDVADQDSTFYVSFDQHQGATLGAQHLLKLGHQKIALINGPKLSPTARLRQKTWTEVLNKQQLQPIADLYGQWTAHSGYLCALQLLNQKIAFTALLVANDQMALGALKALQEYGVHVPDDVSVIGYDDTDDSAYFLPALTTIRQDFHKLGQEAVLHLVSVIKHEQCIESILLPSQLILRQSTQVVRKNNDVNKKEIAHQLRILATQLEFKQ